METRAGPGPRSMHYGAINAISKAECKSTVENCWSAARAPPRKGRRRRFSGTGQRHAHASVTPALRLRLPTGDRSPVPSVAYPGRTGLQLNCSGCYTQSDPSEWYVA